MITSSGHIKIIDFGLSKLIGESGRASTPCGTAAYLAPEIINKVPYDFSVDIWSYGILMIEMIGGFTPF